MNDQNRTSSAAVPAAGGKKSLWRRLIIWITAVGMIAALAIVVIELLRPATYTSEAWLMIRKNPTWLLHPPDGRNQSDENFIENQFEILRSRKLLEPLAAFPEFVRTPELADEKDIPAAIGRQLKIRQLGGSEVYVISFTSVSPENAQWIVKKVVEAYLSYHQVYEARRGETLIQALKKQSDHRFREMTQLRQEVKTKAILLTGTNPFQPDQDDKLDGGRELLKELQSELVRQRVQQVLLAATEAVGNEQQPASTAATGEANPDKLPDAKSEYAATEARVESLQQKIASLLNSNKQFSGDSLDLEVLKSRLAAVTAVHDAVQGRILMLTTEQSGPDRVQLFSEATRPVEPDRRWWEFYR